MTVSGGGPAVQTPLPAVPTQLGAPVGIWSVDESITGDASGGSRVLVLTFAASGQSNPRFYSLEQLTVVDSANLALNCSVITSGMGSRPSGGPGIWRVNLLLRTGGDSIGGLPGDQRNFLPAYLGRQDDRTVAADLAATVTNNDGGVFRVSAAGYVWDSKAMNVAGGLVRPPGPWPR